MYQPPDLQFSQDISRFWIFEKYFLVCSISLEEVGIIIKFLIKMHKEVTPFW